MSRAVVLQHVPHEGPGRIVPVWRDYGIPIETRHLYRGDAVPATLDDVRVLVVMGGPMGVADIASGEYPFLAQEVALLKQCIARDLPVLGICLGAQLLAHAAGGKVYPNAKPAGKPEDAPTPMPEIGWAPVYLPFPGGTEPIVMGLHDGTMMFHWHFDTFDLPKLPPPPNSPPPPAPPPPTGSVLISSTKTCRNQVYRFKDHLFGFQYHVEMDEEGIDGMLSAGKEDVLKVLGPEGVEKIRQDTKRYYPQYERLGNRVLGNFVQYLKLY